MSFFIVFAASFFNHRCPKLCLRIDYVAVDHQHNYLKLQAGFIIIECHGGAAYTIVCTDENGNNLVFAERAVAESEVADCQNGLVVEILT